MDNEKESLRNKTKLRLAFRQLRLSVPLSEKANTVYQNSTPRYPLRFSGNSEIFRHKAISIQRMAHVLLVTPRLPIWPSSPKLPPPTNNILSFSFHLSDFSPLCPLDHCSSLEVDIQILPPATFMKSDV